MPYVTQSELETIIPPSTLVDMLDDDRDGLADDGLLDNLIASAGNAVDAYLSGLFSVPFATPPPAVREAALVFCCESLYARRGLGEGDKNPLGARARFWRDRLQKIGNGELPLSAATEKAFAARVAITEDADLDSSLR
jgi:phage gp36-like protein